MMTMTTMTTTMTTTTTTTTMTMTMTTMTMTTMTKAPTGFFTLQALTALSSAAIIGVAGFLAQQSALEEEQQTAQEAQQEALVGQAVALKVAEITVQQQAEVDAALATVETLRQEYEAALDRAQRVSVAAAPPPAASATAPASTPPSPSPSAPKPQPAAPAAPAPVDGNSGGS
jgi:hypothetical protein